MSKGYLIDILESVVLFDLHCPSCGTVLVAV